MVKIMSYFEYNRRWRRFPPNISVVFRSSEKEILELLRSKEHRVTLAQILHNVEGCKFQGDKIVNKFVKDELIPLSDISEGCKTAFMAYLQHLESVPTLLNLTGCGPVALSACLELINDTQVTGVVGIPLDIADEYTKYLLEVDGVQSQNWFTAYAAGAKMSKEHLHE